VPRRKREVEEEVVATSTPERVPSIYGISWIVAAW
jgi:hypothetical protein